MSHYERPHALRLRVAFEAEALISHFGGEAYGIACQRAEEASSEMLARDWSEVALAIACKTGGRKWGLRMLQRLGFRMQPLFATDSFDLAYYI